MLEAREYYNPEQRVWRVEIKDEERVLAGSYIIIKDQRAKIGYIISNKSGMGSQVLEKIIQLARELNCSEIVGDFTPVPESYRAALNLYSKYGFVLNKKNQTIRLELEQGSRQA